ncbi:basic helix-loop-helix (bHLH) DNA-binding superfamily protein [Rhynchospora pubera]|uniref:Basic helix-loop-helix (BHLH) DNA-binding superfamily protein n=1 Tax=Rhynchospora pubera TaxID=906938 RepID=A0AAV8BY65_9POAL|nr:basic helix-loop-helix (bHLH) DNA-binding superfamily protein [Rhynchospora pubera]
MELQGNKATHDFLSLYTKDSSFQHQDPRPPPQGFFLKTHDFLQPLERGGGEEKGENPPRDVAGKGPTEHVLPGGIGTFSICHVADGGARPVVKPELVSCGPVSKPEPDTAGGYARFAGVAGAPFSVWSESASRESASRGGHWSLPYVGRASGAPTSSATRHNQATERKGYMDAVSRSSRGFDDDDNDVEEFRREASSSLKELTVRTDGKGSGSGSDQRPNTPRSKHSATEQRRRSKINDRFQILRELIPHSDQKRDKASFLLEVIEYIRFLQEKVQKYEAAFPDWNQDNSKLMPWANAYFRSFWKNAENKSINGDAMPDPTQIMKNGASGPAFTFPAGGAATESTAPSPMEASTAGGFPYKSSETSKSYSHFENATSETPPQPPAQVRAPSQWLKPAAAEECSASRETITEPEELTIDEGTISLSSNYSQELLTVLSQALQSSGIDLSQASISVQINLGKRASNQRAGTTGTASTSQEHKDATSDNHAKGQPTLHALKRRKSDNNS